MAVFAERCSTLAAVGAAGSLEALVINGSIGDNRRAMKLSLAGSTAGRTEPDRPGRANEPRRNFGVDRRLWASLPGVPGSRLCPICGRWHGQFADAGELVTAASCRSRTRPATRSTSSSDTCSAGSHGSEKFVRLNLLSAVSVPSESLDLVLAQLTLDLAHRPAMHPGAVEKELDRASSKRKKSRPGPPP
jgi:hypothetical protein